MSYIYSVCLGFDKYNFSSPEGALKKALELNSNLTKIQIQPLDVDDDRRQAIFDVKTFKSLCNTEAINLVLKTLIV